MEAWGFFETSIIVCHSTWLHITQEVSQWRQVIQAGNSLTPCPPWYNLGNYCASFHSSVANGFTFLAGLPPPRSFSVILVQAGVISTYLTVVRGYLLSVLPVGKEQQMWTCCDLERIGPASNIQRNWVTTVIRGTEKFVVLKKASLWLRTVRLYQQWREHFAAQNAGLYANCWNLCAVISFKVTKTLQCCCNYPVTLFLRSHERDFSWAQLSVRIKWRNLVSV
jgi:hypothetical protein